MIFEKVVKIIAENVDMAAGDMKMETTFEEIGLDSLDTVELLMSLEEEFGFAIEISENLKTIGDVVKLIEEKQ